MPYRGVKQGCMLSPTLFNLCRSELSEVLKAENLNEVELRQLPLSCMLYADDLVIFSNSKNGRQDCLDSLSEYCNDNDLSVNLDKIKVLIFNNCGRTMNKHVLYYRDKKLGNVSNYNYLGVQFGTNGNFTYAKQKIKKVALIALYKLQKEMGDHFRDDIQLTMKIFDTVVTPILTYGGEVWGVDHNGKLENDPIESVQIKFIRWLLGVNKFCSSNARRSEVGQ